MDKLINIVGKVLNVKTDNLSFDTSIDDIEEWDSLNHLRLVSEVEEIFDIEIPFDEIKNIKKIKNFSKYIKKGIKK